MRIVLKTYDLYSGNLTITETAQSISVNYNRSYFEFLVFNFLKGSRWLSGLTTNYHGYGSSLHFGSETINLEYIESSKVKISKSSTTGDYKLQHIKGFSYSKFL